MASFLAAKSPDIETQRTFEQGLDLLLNTTLAEQALKAARLVVGTLEETQRYALRSIVVPDGHVFLVAAHQHTAERVVGEYSSGPEANGKLHVIEDPVTEIVEGGLQSGDTFEGHQIVIGDRGWVVVNKETGMGCMVPEPPEAHLRLSPVVEWSGPDETSTADL